MTIFDTNKEILDRFKPITHQLHNTYDFKMAVLELRLI